jgi:hypothetical protein
MEPIKGISVRITNEQGYKENPKTKQGGKHDHND